MIKINRLIIFTCSLSLILGCSRNTELLKENQKWEVSDLRNNARVKFVYGYASTTPALTSGAGPNLAIYMDNTKLSGNTATSNFLSYTFLSGTSHYVFPTSSTYAVVPPGDHTFYFIMNRFSSGTFKPNAGDTIFKTTFNLQAAKKYSVFLTDTVQNPGILVKEDVVQDPPPATWNVRYANLTANTNERVDVYSKKLNTLIFTNVGYKEVTSFKLYDMVSSDTLQVRLTGTTTVRETVNNFSPTAQGNYTMMSRGRTGLTGRAPSAVIFLTK
jgi:hypothetical protein